MIQRSLLLLAIVLLISTGVASAGKEVPLKGSAMTELESFDDATLSAVFVITRGKATHLGRITGVATVYYDPVTWIPVKADQTLIAANGDELYITATFGAYVITGGTGRFEDASGSGVLTAVNIGDPEDGIVAVTWNGTISY